MISSNQLCIATYVVLARERALPAAAGVREYVATPRKSWILANAAFKNKGADCCHLALPTTVC